MKRLLIPFLMVAGLPALAMEQKNPNGKRPAEQLKEEQPALKKQKYGDTTLYEKLYEAISNGQRDQFNTLIQNVLFMDRQDALYNTINMQDENGQTLLHIACKKGNADMALVLIKNGANVLIQDKKGATALHYAAQSGLIAVLALSVKAEIINRELSALEWVMGNNKEFDFKKRHVLDYCIKNNQITIFKTIFEMLNDADCKRLYLHFLQTAIEYSKKEITHYLIAYADNLFGKTALHIAAKDGNVYLIDRLVNAYHIPIDILDRVDDKPIVYAVDYGHIEALEFFINTLHFNIYDKVNPYDTVLHVATRSNKKKIIKLLVTKYGMNPNIRNGDGESSLDLCLDWINSIDLQKRCETMALLLSLGAHAESKNSNGDTVLHKAVKERKEEIVKLLLLFGCKHTIKNNEGKIPEQLAPQGSVMQKMLLDPENYIKQHSDEFEQVYALLHEKSLAKPAKIFQKLKQRELNGK